MGTNLLLLFVSMALSNIIDSRCDQQLLISDYRVVILLCVDSNVVQIDIGRLDEETAFVIRSREKSVLASASNLLDDRLFGEPEISLSGGIRPSLESNCQIARIVQADQTFVSYPIDRSAVLEIESGIERLISVISEGLLSASEVFCVHVIHDKEAETGKNDRMAGEQEPDRRDGPQ